MLDTHCHLTFPDFEGRLDEVMDRAMDAGITGAITISTTSHDAPRVLAIANAHPRVWCSAGVHPLYADRGGVGGHDWDAIRFLASQERCVAFGEMGLDQHYDSPDQPTQRATLEDQLGHLETWRGEGLELPVVIHCRKAFDDLIPILAASSLDPTRFVFHCFTGTPEEAGRVIDLGAMISFTGVVTYKNAGGVAQAAREVPLERIMCETDAPFLSPEPKRGVRPCEPAFTRHTAEFIARERGLAFAEFERAINANTERFFGIRVPERTQR